MEVWKAKLVMEVRVRMHVGTCVVARHSCGFGASLTATLKLCSGLLSLCHHSLFQRETTHLGKCMMLPATSVPQ